MILGILSLFSLSLVLAELNCSDTDDGEDYEEKGSRTLNCTDALNCGVKTDYCTDNMTLIEYYCESDNSGGADEKKCRYGCSAGACTTVSCSEDYLHLCWDELLCVKFNGHWYNHGCHEEAQEGETGSTGAGNNETSNNATENNQTGNQTNSNRGLGQTIRGRVRAGVYTNAQGKQIRVSELAQNRIKLKVGDIGAETELEIEQETDANKTKFKVKLKNNRSIEIKIMPDIASATALQILRLKNCSSADSCIIELKDVGKNNQSQLVYELQRQRHFRFLGLFRKRAQVRAQVDAETGAVVAVQKPWWVFLASEPEE
ncbi:hypothetical protein CMI37_38195 [Candidatus Pacearchaeota archaeon]|nr:hypothetical protein [Candidatus Pacearchaeota archaeon]